MGKIFFGTITALLFLAVAIVSVRGTSEENRSPVPGEADIGGKTYALEIADTDEERQRGLGGRESLCAECAMLFMFDRSDRHAFWMKEMRFPLDIVWLSDDTIVHIERRVPADSPDIFRPEGAADKVLEFNAGEADALQAGDRVGFSY